jgi:hypothetical protein
MAESKQNQNIRPAWYQEDHELLVSMNNALVAHIAQDPAVQRMLNDHECILQGADHKGGLIAAFAGLETKVKIIVGILSSLGLAAISAVGWLIVNFINISNTLNAISKVAIR